MYSLTLPYPLITPCKNIIYYEKEIVSNMAIFSHPEFLYFFPYPALYHRKQVTANPLRRRAYDLIEYQSADT